MIFIIENVVYYVFVNQKGMKVKEKYVLYCNNLVVLKFQLIEYFESIIIVNTYIIMCFF